MSFLQQNYYLILRVRVVYNSSVSFCHLSRKRWLQDNCVIYEKSSWHLLSFAYLHFLYNIKIPQVDFFMCHWKHNPFTRYSEIKLFLFLLFENQFLSNFYSNMKKNGHKRRRSKIADNPTRSPEEKSWQKHEINICWPTSTFQRQQSPTAPR